MAVRFTIDGIEFECDSPVEAAAVERELNGLRTMANVLALAEDSGLSLHEIGLRMGYAETTARQAVWQFFRSSDPRIGTLRKFAKAMDVPVRELI